MNPWKELYAESRNIDVTLAMEVPGGVIVRVDKWGEEEIAPALVFVPGAVLRDRQGQWALVKQ